MRREAWRNFATATLFSPKYNPHAATANQQASTALVSPPKVKSWVCSQVAASQDKSGCWRRCCKAFRAGIPFSNTLVTWCNLLFSSQGLTEILFIHSWPTGLIQPVILTYTCLWPLLHCFCLDEQNTSLLHTALPELFICAGPRTRHKSGAQGEGVQLTWSGISYCSKHIIQSWRSFAFSLWLWKTPWTSGCYKTRSC